MGVNKRLFRTAILIGLGFSLCIVFFWAGARWPNAQIFPDETAFFPQETAKEAPTLHAFPELMKLAVAFLLGLVVTSVHKHYHRDKLLSRSLEQAETLLCVAGALMMIIIGGSLARAFGVFGAASLVRFRTPVDDPKDATILFILLGIGMAAGSGSLGVAVLAALSLCLFIFILGQLGEDKPRAMLINVKADGSDFPKAHVENIFAAYQAVFETREVSQGKDATVQYYVVLEPNTPLDVMSEQLMASGYAGIKSVTWEQPKKRD